MYLKQLKLKNTGPIEHIDIECQSDDEGSPKPIIFVGQNGSGKSISTSHIVNALIEANGTIFDDADVEKGKVYKLRTPSYTRHGTEYSTAEVHLTNSFSVYEAQLTKLKNEFDEPFPDYPKWNEISEYEHSHYNSNFHDNKPILKDCLKKATHLFFPPNRFEEPAWLNELNLRNKASYASFNKLDNLSNRPVVNYAPMSDLQNWLLDLIYDCNAIERSYSLNALNQLIEHNDGPATKILNPIQDFLRSMFGKKGKFTWHVGPRNERRIGFSIDDTVVADNLFQLSTGQTVLLGLFLTIIRDFDLGSSELTQLSDIKGIVVVDEVDLHLHTDLQHDLLPKLIKEFPNVQFILTTHSPLFLIGMENIFKSRGFQLIQLPDGQEIDVERFSEFKAAYKHLKDSARFQEDVRREIEDSQKPLMFLEGTTDIAYIEKAAVLLEKTDLFDKFQLKEAGGSSNLDAIWKSYTAYISAAIPQKILLLYDCDVDKIDDINGKLYRKKIVQQNHKIKSGIENLFSDATIEKAKNYKKEIVDVTNEHSSTERGIDKKIPETWKINKDEKRNLCNWLCENGTNDDFSGFSIIFEILEEVLGN